MAVPPVGPFFQTVLMEDLMVVLPVVPFFPDGVDGGYDGSPPDPSLLFHAQRCWTGASRAPSARLPEGLRGVVATVASGRQERAGV